MTLKEFLNSYNEAPYGLEEIADIASNISDSPALAKAAEQFVKNTAELETLLEEVGFEFG